MNADLGTLASLVTPADYCRRYYRYLLYIWKSKVGSISCDIKLLYPIYSRDSNSDYFNLINLFFHQNKHSLSSPLYN